MLDRVQVDRNLTFKDKLKCILGTTSHKDEQLINYIQVKL